MRDPVSFSQVRNERRGRKEVINGSGLRESIDKNKPRR